MNAIESKITIIKECPHGTVTGACVTADCFFQHGKWKGVVIPDVSFTLTDKNELELTCDSMETNNE